MNKPAINIIYTKANELITMKKLILTTIITTLMPVFTLATNPWNESDKSVTLPNIDTLTKQHIKNKKELLTVSKQKQNLNTAIFNIKDKSSLEEKLKHAITAKKLIKTYVKDLENIKANNINLLKEVTNGIVHVENPTGKPSNDNKQTNEKIMRNIKEDFARRYNTQNISIDRTTVYEIKAIKALVSNNKSLEPKEKNILQINIPSNSERINSFINDIHSQIRIIDNLIHIINTLKTRIDNSIAWQKTKILDGVIIEPEFFGNPREIKNYINSINSLSDGLSNKEEPSDDDSKSEDYFSEVFGSN